MSQQEWVEKIEDMAFGSDLGKELRDLVRILNALGETKESVASTIRATVGDPKSPTEKI